MEERSLLRGSPKALGWDVDEDEEDAAWSLLMADAMETTIYEKVIPSRVSHLPCIHSRYVTDVRGFTGASQGYECIKPKGVLPQLLGAVGRE